MNGMNTSCTWIGTKLSVSVVTMCTPVKASASSAVFRCSPAVTNLGQAGRSYRTEVSRPAAMFRVSSTSATRPVARVRYHSGVVEVITRAPGATPPADSLLATAGTASTGAVNPVMLCFPLASGAPPASPFPLPCTAFPRRSVAGSFGPQSRRCRAPPARSCCVGGAWVARPAGGGFCRAVLPDQTGGQAGVAQPGQGRRAPDDRRGAGGVGVDAAARGHADRPPAGPGRLAGRRVDDVVHALAAAPGPGAHGGARGGQPAGADRHRLPWCLRPGRVVVGDPYPPAAAGRRTG